MKRQPAGVRLEGASQARTSWRDRLRAWIRHHRLSAADSLYRLLESPVASLMTWLVIGIALALPVGLDLLLDSARQLSDSLDSPAQLTVFIEDEVPLEGVRALEREFSALEGVANTRLVTREAALEEFRALSGFADILDSLDQNPLPNLLVVEPSAGIDPQEAHDLRARLEQRPEIAEVVLDMEWLQRLNSMLELGRRGVLAAGSLLVLGVILILGNTIRLAIENRREEIVIVKLVGGSDAFVRRPFLYTGLWYGVGGGACAGLLVAAALWFLSDPVAELAALYQGSLTLPGRGLMGALNVILLGGALGLLGAWLAVARHLSSIQPR